MKTALLSDPLFLQHVPGGHPVRVQHPERPERLTSILDVLDRRPVAGTLAVPPRPATREELLRAHLPAHVDAMEQLRGKETVLDEDTLTSKHSIDAALLAAGAGVVGVQT